MASADFTIADVLAWARTKPADEWFRYNSPGNCALCMFLRETCRATEPRVVPSDWRDGLISNDLHPLPHGLDGALHGGREADGGDLWTFGALVQRLEALCPETPVTPSNWQSIDAYLTDIEDVARERVSA